MICTDTRASSPVATGTHPALSAVVESQAQDQEADQESTREYEARKPPTALAPASVEAGDVWSADINATNVDTADETGTRVRTPSGLTDGYRGPSGGFLDDVGSSFTVQADRSAGKAPDWPEFCCYCGADLLAVPRASWVCDVAGQDVTARPVFTGYRGNRGGRDVKARLVECGCVSCEVNSRPKRQGKPRKVCTSHDCKRKLKTNQKRKERRTKPEPVQYGPATQPPSIIGRNSA